jgi:hypothetical protein
MLIILSSAIGKHAWSREKGLKAASPKESNKASYEEQRKARPYRIVWVKLKVRSSNWERYSTWWQN